MVFAVKLTSASGNEVTASWSTADGTATAPADYTAVTNSSISIPLGSLTTALTVTLNVAENQVDEPDKQFTVTLGSLANAGPGDLTASGTIADDDLPNVSLAGGDPIVEGASAQFTLTRDGTLIPLPVSIAVTQVGEFIAGTDQTTASFDANADTLVVAVPTADDDMDEAAGSITLTVQAGGTTYATVAPASATVTVTDNDLPTLTIAAVDMEVTEGGQAQFQVTREDSDHAASLDFRVFAKASTGYFVQSVFVVGTIAANSSSAVVRVGVEDDIVDGEDGELTVQVGTSNAYHAGTPAQVTIPIRDNDTAGATPALTVRDATCPEDTSVRLCLVTIALNRAATAAFTAILRTEDGTARGSSGGGGADFKHRAAKRVEFGIGDQNDVVNIVLTSDRTDEEDETFSAIVALAAGTDASAVIIADDTGTITITDDDPPARLSLDDAAGSEGDGSIGFVARLNPESGKEITLSWVTGDGSATAPADYTAGTGTVTFAAGETRKTIDVPLQDDADTEASETLQLTLTRTGATDADDVVLADPMATGTITDNDAILILSLTVNPTTISEGEQATVTVTADSAPLDPLTISLVVSGTAAADDYTIVPSSITIAAGTTSGSAIVTAVDDDLAEGRESIVLSARLGGTEIGSATITLNDNDSATWDLTVSPGTVTEGQQATVTASTGGVIFADDQTIILTFTGNATAPADYTITPASITITAGATSGSATITTQDDALVEGDETIAIRARHDGAEIGTRNITIEDNDTADFSLTVDTDTITEEGAGSATVTVSTGGATFASAQTISLTLGGSATATADYTIAPANITIAANATSGSATVTALDDSLVEGREAIAITASQGGSVEIGITDNDAASFSLTVDAATITEEGSGSATITVDTGGATFATAQTISLTLGGGATAGEDYTIAPASITLAANQTSGSATVTAVDDMEVEEAETITIAATHGTTPIGSGAIGITDNDVPQFALSVSAATVAEGESTTVTVETGGVTFATAQTITLGLDGSATVGEDYTIAPASITITAGATSGSATVTVVDDTLLEDAETITIEASRDATPFGTVEITISASDQTAFTLLAAAPFILEGESTTVTVETGGVTFATAQTITLEFSGGATVTEDYVAPASITLAANQTSGSATITAIDDSQVENDETITLAASHDGALIGTRNVTIVDNDTADFTLTVSPATIDEGDDAIVTVDTGGVAFAIDQTITLVLERQCDGHGRLHDHAGEHHPCGQRDLGQRHPHGGRRLHRGRQRDHRDHGTPRHDDRPAANATIADNDTAMFSLEVDPDAIAEEGTGSATVTVDTGGVTFASAQTITLELSGSATAEEDYTITPANITIAADATSGSATVTARDDTVVEDAESIALTASHEGTAIGSLAIRIEDNDAPQFALTASADTVAEGESTTVTVDTGGVTFATAQRIALELGGSATAGEDYTITPASITIAADATSGSATITALDDTEQEDAETITLAASHDAAPIGTLDISISASDQTAFSLLLFPEDAAITEGESATVTVDTGGVTFATAQTITLELSGSATAEEDYTITPASITIAADATSGSATITTADDAEAEGTETITIAASHEAVAIGTRNLTINDNDAAFSLTVHPATIAEGEAAIVTVDTGGVALATAQTITLELSGSATAEEDYTITPASITIAAAATSGSATITALDDSDAEGAETITLAASHDATPIGTAEVTILASDETDERTAFSLAVSSRSIAEGEQATVTVDTGGATFATDQSVTLVLAGSATEGVGNDYTIVPRSITIPANQTLGSATVTALNDSLTEGAETIAIAASHDGTEIGTATITIRDQVDDTRPDDDTRPEVTAITSTARFPANAAFAVTITFSERVTGLAVAAIEVTNGAAAKLAGSGTTYTMEVTPRADFQGSATVTVPADAATDAAGNGNLAGSAEFAVDTRAPTVKDATLDQPLGTWTGSTDTGAPTSSGLVRYSGAAAPAPAAASPPRRGPQTTAATR